MRSKFAGILTAFMSMLALDLGAAVPLSQYRVEVLHTYPHDTKSYTQGLFFHDGFLYESTGLHGLSTFRKNDYKSGKALQRLNFDRKYFVEGSVEKDGKIYILTWQNNLVFEYDAKTLEYRKSYSYPREGWGLTTDGKNLIASDGSSYLYFLDESMRTLRKIQVKIGNRPLSNLNELEYIDGRIWANVYLTDLIVIIDPASGRVTGTIDCTGLLSPEEKDENTDVLNGIAYDPSSGRIFVTGKNWCKLFEIRLKEIK